jgi:hypothetical protein
VLCVSDCIRDCIWFAIPQPTEWQRGGNEINAAVGNWNAGRTTWIADVHRDGKRFVVRAEEKVTAFLRLEAAIRVTTQYSFGLPAPHKLEK